MFNNEWHDGLNENQARKYILIVLAMAAIIIFLFRKDIVKTFNWYDQNEEWRKQDYEQEYSGIIVKKGKDKRNHNFEFFQLNDSSKIFENREKIWKKVYVGDSVYKRKNSKLLYIFRKGKTFVIDYEKIYKYRDSLIRAGKY